MHPNATSFTLLTFAVILCVPISCNGSGSCSCRKDQNFSRLGVFDTIRAARRACRQGSRCMIDNCGSGCKCDPISCLSESRATPLSVNGTSRFACDFRCVSGFGMCRASGRNDPHMHGFDGSRFDFHGVHGRTYAIFGRYDGEKLVARMRGAEKVTRNITHTFFDAFGLTTEGGKRAEISLVNQSPENRNGWKTSISIDDLFLKENFESKELTVLMGVDKKKITVKTPLAIYHFKASSNKGAESQHLDIAIDLAGEVRQEGDYIGVLGFTLNKALDVSIHESLKGKAFDREQAMREHFETDGLFPIRLDDVDTMRGVSRVMRRTVPSEMSKHLTARISHSDSA